MSALRYNRRHQPFQFELSPPFPIRLVGDMTLRRHDVRPDALMLLGDILPGDTQESHEPGGWSSVSAVDPAVMLRMQHIGRRLWSLGAATTPHTESRRTHSRLAILRILEEGAEDIASDRAPGTVSTETRDNDEYHDSLSQEPR